MNPQKGRNTLESISLVLLLLSTSFLPLFSESIAGASHEFSSSYSLNFEEPLFSTITTQNQSYTQVSIPDCALTDQPGSAHLPFYAAHLVIPDGCRIKEIRIIEKKFTDYSEKIADHPLLPAQEELPFSGSMKPQEFKQNKTWYEQNQFQPSEPFIRSEVSYMNGYPLETIQIFPMRYHPSERLLWFYATLTIKVTFLYEETTFSEDSNQFFRKQHHDADRVKDLVLNPDLVDTYPLGEEQSLDASTTSLGSGDEDTRPLTDSYTGGLCDFSDTIDYVIVTTDDLSDTTEYQYNFTDLLNHREQHDGFNGCIVTIESIDACSDYFNETETFNDSAAHLREFCKDAYLDWNTQYILLGGSWQTNLESRQIVPCRIMTDRDESGSYDTMPSDLYFSNLDGDWYYDANNIWGGGRYGSNDKLSELSVGRIPVWDAEMVSNAVEKIIWYDNCNDENFLRSAGFLGGDLGWTSTSKQYMEEIRVGDGSFSEYMGFEEWNNAYAEYQFDTSSRYYDADFPTENDAVLAWLNAINNNEMSMISHLDHGSYVNTLSLGSGSSLSNSHFFIGTSQACLSGRYTSGESGASTFLAKWDDRGAFAMVLNTGYGYGSSSSTAGKSQLQHKIWWDYFFANQTTNFDHWRLGLAMQYTKDVFSSYIDSFSHVYSYVWYSWNLFGDPAQQLRLNPPENSDPVISSSQPIDGSEHVDKNYAELSVNITDADGDMINWSIETSPDIGSSSGTNEAGETKTCAVSGLDYNTVYTWFVNVSDGTISKNETFLFTTEIDPNNDPPTFSNQSPGNASVNIDVDLETVSLFISDPDGDSFSYSIEGEYIEDISENSVSNGTKTANLLTRLPFDTEIHWFVNASDGSYFVHADYVFTTRSAQIPNHPTGLHIETMNRTAVMVNWTTISSADATIIERNTESSWSLGEGSLIYNGSESTVIDGNLLPDIQYHYQAWSWNQTDQVFSAGYAAAENTTEPNFLVMFSDPNLANNSIECNRNLTWSIDLNDEEGDRIDWTISCNNSLISSANQDTNGTKTIILSNLSFDTTYTIYVNATDGFDWTNEWYQFTTELPPDLEKPTITSQSIGASSPLDTSSIGWENLSCTVTDNYEVSSVNVSITYPDESIQNLSLTSVTGSNVWYVNTSFNQHGNYSLIFYAMDAKGNMNDSDIESFSLSPNWDVNNDGWCDLLDFNAISMMYGSEGSAGWIRADVDNNGKISVLDLALVSEHYEEGWWN